MNAYATTGLRELTAQELDQVVGGRRLEVEQSSVAVGFWTGAVLAIAVGALLEWLFG